MRMLALALCVTLAAPAAAAGGDQATARAKKAFQAGTAAFDAGRYDEALRDYTEAYGERPLPGFLFNIGLCHRKLGHHAEAASFFQRYLDAMPNAKNRAGARTLLDEERRLAAAPPRAAPQPAGTPSAAGAPSAPPSTTAATAPAGGAAGGAAAAPEPLAREAAPAAAAGEVDDGALTPWLVGGGVAAAALAVGVGAVTVALVAQKPAPIATIDLRREAP